MTAKTGKETVRMEGDAFIDTTGTAGPPAQCNKYGNGCVMCILRCHTEAICTGTLAGHDAVGQLMGEPPLVLPDSLAIGDGIRYTRQQMMEHGCLDLKYTFSGSVLFDRMNRRGFYTTDREAIERRVAAAGLSHVFAGSADR